MYIEENKEIIDLLSYWFIKTKFWIVSTRLLKKKISLFFKALALWTNAFYKSKCPSVCPCVCSFLRYRLNVFLLPLPKVRYPKILEIQNHGREIMERSGLRFEQFLFTSGLKKMFGWFCLTNHGGNQASWWIRDLWSKGVKLILVYF